MNRRPLAYDIGMNNGDDTEYYLKKGYDVVAVEANPTICREAERRFESQIASGRLKILNIGVAPTTGILDFYLDNRSHTTSTFVPQPNTDGRYSVIPIEVHTLGELFGIHGMPELLKIDIEGLDFDVLKSIFEINLLPSLVSAEAHTVDVLCLLIVYGYDQFKILEGNSVGISLRGQQIKNTSGECVFHEFSINSSGPFGDDYDAPWLDKNQAMMNIASMNNTWRDVQCKHTKLHYLSNERFLGLLDNPEREVELAYMYWRRYPDVAGDLHFGEHGDLGLNGAHTHFEQHGRHEGRIWGEES